jgi:hypothetical protein
MTQLGLGLGNDWALIYKHHDDFGAFCDGPFGYVQLLLSTNTFNSHKGVSMLASSWI